MLGDKNVLKKLIRIVSHIDVGPISEANIKTWHFLNGRLRVGGASAKLADIANQKFDGADIGPIKCVTWEYITQWLKKYRKYVVFSSFCRVPCLTQRLRGNGFHFRLKLQ
jgi:hypothetical protein